MGTRLHCDECNKIVRMTMKCYCDMDICQECYLQNLKHEHWNILHRLAIIQSKCRIIFPALFLAVFVSLALNVVDKPIARQTLHMNYRCGPSLHRLSM